MRVLLLFFFMACSFCAAAQTFTVFTGTYTGSGSKGIYVYRFNSGTAKLQLISNTDSVASPSYLAVAKNSDYVYAVNETHGDNPGSLSAFRYDKATGTLTLINSQPTGGDDPCYVSLTGDRKWAVVANYSGGSVSAFRINEDGSLQPYSQLIQDSGKGVNASRQEKAHVHAAVFSPDEHFLYTPDLGTDKIMVYKFDPSAEKPLQPAEPPFVPAGSGNGPRHLIFHPNGKFAYLVEELSGTAVAFQHENGRLTFLQRITTHPANYKGNIGSADIHVSADGKFLYVSNRGDANSIAICSIDQSSGKLHTLGFESTSGRTPRNFTLDPTGNYLLVANQDSDNIIIFKRDKQTGLLKKAGKQTKVPMPVCLKIAD